MLSTNKYRCRDGAPDLTRVTAWKPGNKRQEQGGDFHDIVRTQINICQLQGMLDMFPTYPHKAALRCTKPTISDKLLWPLLLKLRHCSLKLRTPNFITSTVLLYCVL